MADSQAIVLPDRSVTYWLADSIAAVSEGVWRLFRLSGYPPLTRHAAMVMPRDCTLVGTKAKNELGYWLRVTVEEGLAALHDARDRLMRWPEIPGDANSRARPKPRSESALSLSNYDHELTP